jgi:hypothetical protein
LVTLRIISCYKALAQVSCDIIRDFYVLHDFAGTRDIIASDDEIHLTLPFQTEASFAITQILSGKITFFAFSCAFRLPCSFCPRHAPGKKEQVVLLLCAPFDISIVQGCLGVEPSE